jgi:predicted DNA-binding transcriptional regulator AlpA
MRIDAANNTNGHAELLSASQAAKLLGISRKTLWNYSAPRGDIPVVTGLGRVLRYRRESLLRWIIEHELGAPNKSTG